MIQRIQTIYLMLALACVAMMCFFPPMSFLTDETVVDQHLYTMDFRHIHESIYDGDRTVHIVGGGVVMNIWGLYVLTISLGVLIGADILLYRRRILQARLNVVSAVLCLGWYAMLIMYAWFMVHRFNVDWYIEWGAALPLVVLLLLMMATRRILADEALVRSANRIR